MRQQTSPAIILRRTDYGEADRIVTFLTPVGKVRAMVKGVRRSKSKLAGGIELFSESTITFLQTRGDLSRVISSRLITHWDGIVGDLQRMLFGYEVMKLMDQKIEDDAERDYYDLLKETLSTLADSEIPLDAVKCWFYVHLYRLEGVQLNTETDINGKKLDAESLYSFDAEAMCFASSSHGLYRAEHIKLLRLMSAQPAKVLKQVKGITEHAKTLQNLFTTRLG